MHHRTHPWLTLIALAALIYLPAPASAGGFSQGLQGGPSAGISGAVTARPDVPEAGYYNPAGWALQRKWGLSTGGSGLFPLIIHESDDGTRTRAEVSGAFPPFIHAYGRMGDFAAGLSIDVPYGAGVDWPDDWPGRFEATSTSIRGVEAAPSVAWRPIDEFAIGAGPRVLWATMGLQRYRDLARDDREGFISLNTSGVGLGAQVGVWGRIHDYWTAGASWRSATTVDLEGMAHFENFPPEMQPNAHDTPASTTMQFPHRFALGIAYEMPVVGRLSVDFEYDLWSSYDTLAIDFESEDIEGIEQERNWSNTVSMRAGVESRPVVQGVVLRSGLAYEPSPAPRESISAAQPSTDRMLTSLGAGYMPFEGMEVDAAYNFIVLNSTLASDSGMSGLYGGHVHAFTLGIHIRPELER